MLAGWRARIIGGLAARLPIRISGAVERARRSRTTATRSKVVKGRRDACAGQAEAKICLFPHKWMQPVPLHSHRQDAAA